MVWQWTCERFSVSKMCSCLFVTQSLKLVNGGANYIYTESGFRNWVSKTGHCKIIGLPIFQGRPQYIKNTTINMYLIIKIKHNVHKLSRRNYDYMGFESAGGVPRSFPSSSWPYFWCLLPVLMIIDTWFHSFNFHFFLYIFSVIHSSVASQQVGSQGHSHLYHLHQGHKYNASYLCWW